MKTLHTNFQKLIKTALSLTCLLLLSSICFSQLNVGLRAYYPFSGNSNDISGNNNNPTTTNATLTTDRFGNPNSAYLFNGTSNFIRIPNSPTLNMANQISLCTMIRVNGFYGGTCHGNRVIMKGDADYLSGNYLIGYDDNPFTNGGNCNTPVNPNNENFNYSNGLFPFIQTNRWYSVVWTYDGTTSRLYVDCVLRGVLQINITTFTNTNDLFLGCLNSPAYPYWFNGAMDEVRIYNRALTPAEVIAYGGNTCINCTGNTNTTVTKCFGQNIQLNARNGSSYNWTPSTGLSSTTIQSPICTVNNNTTYVVRVIDSIIGCTNFDTVNVVVNPSPISNLRDTTICNGDTIQLNASGGTAYSWTPNYNINNTTIANPKVWPAVTTSYVVTITNAFGCSTKDTIVVTVNDCRCEDSCNWSLYGNTFVKAKNFIGSINNADFKIRTNNTQRMVVAANGNVGINSIAPTKLLDVNGEARVANLPAAAINNSVVLANTNGDLKSLASTGNTSQYLSGNGTWQNIPTTGGNVNAAQGLTIVDNNTVVLGDECGTNGGLFATSREVNMNNLNLYFNTSNTGKIRIGNNIFGEKGCQDLYTRLELDTKGLEDAKNDYSSPNPSLSGLRFADLTAGSPTIPNQTKGVLSLDKDGDVIWVEACCKGIGTTDEKIESILKRLSVVENQLLETKKRITEMDIVLEKNNIVILGQNTPNPFNESTQISYYIPKQFTKAQLLFTGSAGEVVKIIEIKNTGNGKINVFAGDLSSGLYTYTLIIDGKTIETKKMVKQ
jgi:hypothetical protein